MSEIETVNGIQFLIRAGFGRKGNLYEVCLADKSKQHSKGTRIHSGYVTAATAEKKMAEYSENHKTPEAPEIPVPAPVNYGPNAAKNFAQMIAQAVSPAAVAFWTRKLESLPA